MHYQIIIIKSAINYLRHFWWFTYQNISKNEKLSRSLILNEPYALKNMADWITEGHIKEETLYGIELLNEPAVSTSMFYWANIIY